MKIVVFCGGNGAGTICSALISNDSISVATIINGYDDGKSTGMLRRAFGGLGVSDIRKNHLHFLSVDKRDRGALSDFIGYRFPSPFDDRDGRLVIESLLEGRQDKIGVCQLFWKMRGREREYILRCLSGFIFSVKNEIELKKKMQFDFADCSLGNLIYVGSIFNNRGLIQDAVQELETELEIRGCVQLVSNDVRWLVGITKDGGILSSEEELDLRNINDLAAVYTLETSLSRKLVEDLRAKPIHEKIRSLSGLDRSVVALRSAIEKIESADVILYGPGTLSTSILPTLRLREVCSAIANNVRARKIFVANVGDSVATGNSVDDSIAWIMRRISESAGCAQQLENYVNSAIVDAAAPVSDDIAGRIQIVRADIVDDLNLSLHSGSKTSEAILGLCLDATT